MDTYWIDARRTAQQVKVEVLYRIRNQHYYLTGERLNGMIGLSLKDMKFCTLRTARASDHSQGFEDKNSGSSPDLLGQ